MQMKKTVQNIFPIEGLGCAACVLRVENALRKVEGVENVSVSLASNSARVAYDPGRVTPEQLRVAVQEAGYGLIIPESDNAEAVEDEAEKAQARHYRRLRRSMWLAILLAVAVFVLQLDAVSFKGKGFLLYHANRYDQTKTFESLMHDFYHRQNDVLPTESLLKLIHYIVEHDKARNIILEDYKKLPQRTKKQKRYYKKAEQKARRLQIRRVDMLLDSLKTGKPVRQWA